MNKSLFCKLAVYSLFSVILASCAAEEPAKKSSGGSSKPPAEETPSSAAPLALQISTTYQDTETPEFHEFTQTGTTTCEATAASPNVTCSIVVPEGRLYYSEMNLHFSWKKEDCQILEFQPYYYQASNSPTFFPVWGSSSAVCNVSAPMVAPKECYGGAAPHIVPEFPKNLFFIYVPEEGSTATYLMEQVDIPSAYSLRYRSNRMTSNDLAMSKYGANQVVDIDPIDGYVANTFVNYTFACRDHWYDPVQYQIHLNITDEDSGPNGPLNTYRTWREIP